MITIMSPTKTFREVEEGLVFDKSKLVFNQAIEELLGVLGEYKIDDLSSLMKMSNTLGEINYKRYQYFEQDIFKAYPAILYYHGEAFKGLEADTLVKESLEFAQQHLRILSGFYGILRPLDIIKEYRLEMATRLPNSRGKDLYVYWRERLTEQILNELAQTTGDQILLNVASEEYSKAINLKEINKNSKMVTVVFKEQKGDIYKVIGTYAKKARGKLVRYILENQIDTLEDVKQFNEDSYHFNRDLSDEQIIVFTR